ncbi:MAG: DUF4340 domain-containing protein [Chloroflexota bacterium]|nr:DUF4340 domain-containing protein [Chloroflexota bacterium]MDE2960546.1 DUF4340 domain-containing protein [Chloroflexota bacterium]
MNIRLTILLVFVLALFGALALWFKPWEQDAPREEEPWAWRIDDDAIVRVEVTNRSAAGGSIECSDETIALTGEEQSVAYDKDLGRGKWFIVDGDEREEVYQARWAGTPLLLSGPKVNRVLGETIDNPAQYGLDPPETVITITEETGLAYEFWLGNLTPDEGYSYMRLVGDSQLLTVPEVWRRVVNCLAVSPPVIPPPLELGYFYEEEFRDIQELEITHEGVTATYAPEAGARTWHVTIGDDRQAVVEPEWWFSQLQWFGQPSKPGGPDTPGGWHVEEDGASDPQYGLQPPMTRVRIKTHEKMHEFYIGGGHTEVDLDNRPILDDAGNTQVLVHYAGLPGDPIVYVINRVRAERTFCLVEDPPTERPYNCP